MENQTTTEQLANNSLLKASNIIDKIVLALFCVGIYLKWAHIVGGGALIIIVLSSFSFFYFLLSIIIVKTFKINSQNGLINVATRAIGFGLAILINGVLFKIEFWNNGTMFLAIGLLLITVGSAMMSSVKEESGFRPVIKLFTARIIIALVVGIMFYFTSSIALYRFMGPYGSDPHYLQLMKDCEQDRNQCDTLRKYQDFKRNEADSIIKANRYGSMNNSTATK